VGEQGYDEERASSTEGRGIRVDDLEERGFHPIPPASARAREAACIEIGCRERDFRDKGEMHQGLGRVKGASGGENDELSQGKKEVLISGD